MVKIKNNITNILFIIFFIFIAYSKGPTIFGNYKLQNQQSPEVVVKKLSGEFINIPQIGKKTILIFWATWCGPCKVEMSRLNQMVIDGKIKPEQIIAINIQESATTVSQFLNETGYPFAVVLDESGVVSEKYEVSATPTIIFTNEKGLIEWATTGLSPLLGIRMSYFLNN